MLDLCPFCRSPRAERGCAPGRCGSPRAAVELPRASSSSGVLSAPLAPLGVRRRVAAAELREGAGGGRFWLVELDCMHILWKRAPRRGGNPPRSALCVPCTPTDALAVTCVGCGGRATMTDRLERGWIWCRGRWSCPACWEGTTRT